LFKRVFKGLAGFLQRSGVGRRDAWFHAPLTGQPEPMPGAPAGHAGKTPSAKTHQTKRRTAAPDDSAAWLFDEWRLPLGAPLKKRIKAEVAQRLPAASQPSAAQWKMIFSDTPATYVIAGAGAGKSTSLVLRVLVLHRYLGISLDAMTVVTFTRESRRDFIKKITQIFDLFDISLESKKALELVRTFHACILPQIRSLPDYSQLRAFETLGDTADHESDTFSLRINDAQREQLNRCYRDLMVADSDFAAGIARLRSQALQLPALDPAHPDVQKRLVAMAAAAKRDESLCDTIEAAWVAAGAWPIKGIAPCRESLQINGQGFHVNGWSKHLNAYVILGVDPGHDRQARREGAKLALWAESLVKRTLFQAFCDKPLIWLDNYASSSQLKVGRGAALTGPGFEYKPQGERSAAPLLDSFVAAAGFIENLGLEVSAALSEITLGDSDPDRDFFVTLGTFWSALQVHLLAQTPPIMTFNRMFATLGEQQAQTVQSLDDERLRPMTHLMIDEFQDVSPQIVSWVRACLREVRRRGAGLQLPGAVQQSSLLCVGDDWQSIYGWRGSSPAYFMAFPRHFPAHRCTRVLLSENYRSHQYIIDAAEHIVRNAPSMPGKQARACGPQDDQRVPVMILQEGEAELARRIREHYAQGDSILLLYRRSRDRVELVQHLQDLIEEDRGQRLRQMTYHSSKGLQADAVFMLGDCQHTGHSPYKNHVYRLAGLGKGKDLQAYDNAQHDEALRLAYVAITRAVKYCYWSIKPQQDVTAARASSHIDGAQPFFDDRRA